MSLALTLFDWSCRLLWVGEVRRRQRIRTNSLCAIERQAFDGISKAQWRAIRFNLVESLGLGQRHRMSSHNDISATCGTHGPGEMRRVNGFVDIQRCNFAKVRIAGRCAAAGVKLVGENGQTCIGRVVASEANILHQERRYPGRHGCPSSLLRDFVLSEFLVEHDEIVVDGGASAGIALRGDRGRYWTTRA